MNILETVKQFGIGSGSVSRWINQIEPKASSTRQRKIDPKRACRAFWRLSEGHLASS
ncbi:hypothetical protein [Arsenophonus endosymbiont of Bemisia tabaci]|uniref:hypothetical protein n=1 Tax=Arsenophonus endosymbiont of Bemisia tabaci TaxID=536059 RepID=UPI0015F49474|nr:hypothetical protein [Arsenophonus endosymbiont of Bemisia tabaci]